MELKWTGDSMIGINDSLRFTYFFCGDQNVRYELPTHSCLHFSLLFNYPCEVHQHGAIANILLGYNPKPQFCVRGLHPLPQAPASQDHFPFLEGPLPACVSTWKTSFNTLKTRPPILQLSKATEQD